MKKLFIICTLLAILLIGCGNAKTQELKSTIKLEDTFSEVNVEHYSGADTENFSLTEEECKELRAWIETTSLEEVTFSEEEQPSNLNGTNCYVFASASFVAFDLYDMGDGNDYVRIENAWYKVVD